jgi:hypothetical protein
VVFPTSLIDADAAESSADPDRFAFEIAAFDDRACGADDSRAVPRVVANPRNSACATRKKHDPAVSPKKIFRGAIRGIRAGFVARTARESSRRKNARHARKPYFSALSRDADARVHASMRTTGSARVDARVAGR